jgi:glucose repression regulatory protein TUP1
MLSGSRDKCVVFWDTEVGTLHHIIYGHSNSVVKVATSPVEDMFATSGGDMIVRLWKYSTVGKGKTPADREPMVGKRSNLHDLLS